MLLILIAFAVMGYMLGHLRGQKRGWDDAIKVARAWEGTGRDWRMLYDIETADTETERTAIREVRELERMYDGV